MARLLLAVLPSNQDRNPVVGGGNEMQQMRPLATAILAEAARHPTIVASCFYGSPESGDMPKGSLSSLVAQQRLAAAWMIATRQAGDLTVSLNLHSDSGDYRHCGYFYDSISGPVSEWLGRALADAIKSWFGGVVTHADYGAIGYIFARETRAVACPILMEMGTHTILADMVALRDHAGEIARAMIDCMVVFFGLETEPPLDISELRTFGEWALGRCANGEDPRDLPAFRAHLAALGCPDDPQRFGLPG